MIRSGGMLLILMLAFGSANAFTVILKNGRTMEGMLLSEEKESIRFRDIYGVEYSLKKDILNIPAMLDANPEIRHSPAPVRQNKPAPATTIVHSAKPDLAEVARQTRKNRTGKAPVLRNPHPVEVMPAWPDKPVELAEWIARTERELDRQSARCRAAGADPNAKHSYRSDTYIVEGRSVVVSGYWADPDEVDSARRICAQAMLTQKALTLARQDYSAMQPAASSVDSPGTR